MEAFCAWLTEKEQCAGSLPNGFTCRLSTEAERAYACPGGTMAAATSGGEIT